MNYDTWEELRMRVSSCVLMYDGWPVLCENVPDEKQDDEFVLCLRKLPTNKNRAFVVPQTDPKISVQVQLGYVNLPVNTLYTQRMPTRRYRAGLYNENVSIFSLPDSRRPKNNWGHLLGYPGFIDTTLGKYPTVEEALVRLTTSNPEYDEIPDGVAINRQVALMMDGFRKDFILYYRNNKVGFGDGDTFVIPEEFTHLKEVLAQKGLKCRS